MSLQLIIGLAFSMLPVMELRAAIPILIDYGIRNGINYFPYVTLAICLNIITILFVFIFLDFLHHRFMEWKFYRRLWDRWIHNRLRKKIEKLEKKDGITQYLLLLLFISLPLPGTGVWSSSTLSWLLGMDKKKSFITIAIGATIAGIIIFFIAVNLLTLPL